MRQLRQGTAQGSVSLGGSIIELSPLRPLNVYGKVLPIRYRKRKDPQMTTSQYLAELIETNVGVSGSLDEGYLADFVEDEDATELKAWFLDFQTVMTNDEAEELVAIAYEQ